MYRSCRCCRRIANKLLHTVFHLLAMPCIAIAFVATYDSHTNRTVPCEQGECPAPIPNFYSLHSWMGLTTMGLFAMQVNHRLVLFTSFLRKILIKGLFCFSRYIILIFLILIVHRRFLQFLVALVLRVCNRFFSGQSCTNTFYIWYHNIRHGDCYMLLRTYRKSVFYIKVHIILVLLYLKHLSYCYLFSILFRSSFRYCLNSISNYCSTNE